MRWPRLRFAVSLRVMLLVILALGLWLGWMANSVRRQRRAIVEVDKYNGYIKYNYQYKNGKGYEYDYANKKELTPKKSWLPERFRLGLGDDYFQKVTVVRYVDQPLSDATFVPLDDLNGIEELCFLSRGSHHTLPTVEPPPGMDKLTDAGLRRLEGLTQLRRFEVELFTMLDDEMPSGFSLKHLNRSPQLEELNLSGTGITDDAMPPLRSMPRLRELSLWCNRITGSCLAQLRGTHNLEVLELYGNPISSKGFANIAAITSLKELRLSGTGIDDAGLSQLSQLTRLKRLSLDRTKLTDAGLVHLSKMTQLESLDLTGCEITGSGLVALKDMKQLKRLELGWTHVDDDSLKVVEGMPHLEVLELHQTRVTDAAFVHIKGLRFLRVMSLNNTKTTKKGVDALKAVLPAWTDKLW